MRESPELGGIGDVTALDAKAFNKGKGKLLAVMLGMVLIAFGGFAWYLVEDQPNPYGELGKHVNGLRAQYFDSFWTCALPGARVSEIKGAEDLRRELDSRASAGARYGAHLRSKCAPGLRELGTRLRAFLPPADASGKVKPWPTP